MDTETLKKTCTSLVSRAGQCTNEEATKQFLIMPFIAALGYNVFDPDEVHPEHHADFSERNKNRVDYAIMREGNPVIAIEAKTVGTEISKERGQLRGYFNACPTIKLGILTDGIIFECFADTDEPNMMDPTPFLTFCVEDVANGTADERVLQGIQGLTKAHFDPANMGAEARRKLIQGKFIDLLGKWHKEPSESLVKTMLSESDFQARQTAKVVEECTDLAKSAFKLFIDQKLLERVGLNKSDEEAEEKTIPAVQEEINTSGIITTEDELEAFEYAKRRLAFMVDNDEEFAAINDILWQDYQTTFKVFYKKPKAGALFNYSTKADGTMVFFFPTSEQTIETNNIADIDEQLLEAFKQRISA
jgi:predicted type IV restriction endonuclease